MATTVREALEETVSGFPALSEARYAALVSLCRVTADRIDAQGDRPSGQIIAAYLSALKDVDKAISSGPAQPVEPKKGAGDGSSSALGALRGIKGGRAG